jgi:hypothetical protein
MHTWRQRSASVPPNRCSCCHHATAAMHSHGCAVQHGTTHHPRRTCKAHDVGKQLRHKRLLHGRQRLRALGGARPDQAGGAQVAWAAVTLGSSMRAPQLQEPL